MTTVRYASCLPISTDIWWAMRVIIYSTDHHRRRACGGDFYVAKMFHRPRPGPAPNKLVFGQYQHQINIKTQNVQLASSGPNPGHEVAKCRSRRSTARRIRRVGTGYGRQSTRRAVTWTEERREGQVGLPKQEEQNVCDARSVAFTRQR